MIDEKQLLKRVKSLPTLPTAVSRLTAVLHDPKASIKDFEAAVRPDAALTANLLRVANSAFFRRAKEIVSVRHAINMLGEKRIYEIAVTASFAHMIPSTIPGYNIEAESFWLHNIAVAVLAESLAKELNLEEKEMVFTVGLLHDIGKLAIGSFIEEQSGELIKELEKEKKSFIELEKKIFGATHAEVGALVAERWKLPMEVAVVAGGHHEPCKVEEGNFQQLVDLVHIADCLAYVLGYGVDIGELSRKIEQKSVDRLGVTVQKLESTASATLGHIQEMAGIFRQQKGAGK